MGGVEKNVCACSGTTTTLNAPTITCTHTQEAHRNDDTRNEQHPPVAGDAHTANAPHHTASTDTNAGSGYPVPTEVLAVMVGCLCGTGEQQLEPQVGCLDTYLDVVAVVHHMTRSCNTTAYESYASCICMLLWVLYALIPM